MRAYQDKITGKWKWGTRGEAIHETQQIAERYGMDLITDKLRRLRDRLNDSVNRHGK